MDSRDVPNYPPLNGNIETDILQSDISEFWGLPCLYGVGGNTLKGKSHDY